MTSCKYMGFHPTTANSCVMMRESLKRKCCEYIVSQSPKHIVNMFKTKCKLKIKRNIKLSFEPVGIIVCQLRKNLEELHENNRNLAMQDLLVLC